VVVSWVVNESGEVTEVTVVESASRPVDEAVAAAIASWKYQPAIKRGVKVKVKLTLKQTFLSG
jgi:TonB family protein